MCRITGIVTKAPNRESKADLTRMLATLAHGGPDDEGTCMDEHVALGHRRLSIIDLSQGGHQPMHSEDGKLVLVFNGEIYNYREIRRELEVAGASFRTSSDTEVIIKAYQQWGKHSFDRLQGMFAFALYDKIENRIQLVRDPVGIKPLYYFIDDQKLIFASEVRAFMAYDKSWIQQRDWPVFFLAFGSIPHPFTTLNEVYQLPAGYSLDMDLDTFTPKLSNYCAVETASPSIDSLPDAIEKTRDELIASMRRHLISDAPLGVFLSGGIDSSLLTLLADRVVDHDLNAVSVHFKEATFNEEPFQKKVLGMATRIKQNNSVVDETDFWNQIEDIWKAMDQPTIDGVNTYFVSLHARRAGLKVVLSGLGADELFGGYASFKRIHAIDFLRAIPFKGFWSRILGLMDERYKRVQFLQLSSAIGDYLFLRGLNPPAQIAKLLGIDEKEVWNTLGRVTIKVPKKLSKEEYVSFLESKIYMTNQLLKDTDFMSMWHGLEVRVPFLDIELIKLAQRVDPKIRYKVGRPKFLITEAFKDLLPEEIVFRKKSGFTFPFSIWMKHSLDKFNKLLPKTKQAAAVGEKFRMGNVHWTKYWALIVMEKFAKQ